MSLENYAIYLAKTGSKADLAAIGIMAQRQAGTETRLAFNRAHGAVGSCVAALLFDGEPPAGWRKTGERTEEYVVAKPDLKTKEGKALKRGMALLPALHGMQEFTKEIGGDMVFAIATSSTATMSASVRCSLS